MAEFIYECIFCRYLCPGECLIHDLGSEFCNYVVDCLTNSFGIEVRTIRAGRPMANGQAEAAVKNVKTKLKLICLENSKNFVYYYFIFRYGKTSRKIRFSFRKFFLTIYWLGCCSSCFFRKINIFV